MSDPRIYDDDYFNSMRGVSDPLHLYDHFIETFTTARDTGARILDVGCGRGELLERLSVTRGCASYGLDFSAAAVAASRSRMSAVTGTDADQRIVLGSITTPDIFDPASFDLVFMLDIVEHLPEKQLVDGLTNVRRWLKPHGRLCIHTFPSLVPHRLFQGLLLLARKHDALQRLNAIHCNVQTRARLRSFLLRSGFDIERMWLRNDLIRTSSVYQNMPQGSAKKLIAWLATDFAGAAPVRKLGGLLGIQEILEPSIYAVCRAAADPSIGD